MAQYAILIYAQDSAHALDATPQDTEACDEHSDDLAASGEMLAAYALTPRDMATSIRGDAITDGPFVDAKEVSRLGRPGEATVAYREALILAAHDTERAFLEQQIAAQDDHT
jgi:hypothetical protein